MDPALRAAAASARGFMPPDEGEALYHAALDAPAGSPWLEVGTYCGKSAVYLGAAARERNTVVFTVDHHRGSEEIQSGWEHHDPDLVGPDGRMDSLPFFRQTISAAGLEDVVIGVVGHSVTVASWWGRELGLLFIDGAHDEALVRADYEAWVPHLAPDGFLLLHDVFEDPSDGGPGPAAVHALATGRDGFTQGASTGSLRTLRRGG